ncbi:MAG: hypothetical protein ACO1RX_12105 [Candidatus Sericytochromatia bacterium]
MKRCAMFFLILNLCACAQLMPRYKADYTWGMTQTRINNISVINNETNIFEDEFIRINLMAYHDNIAFILQNKTSNTIKIIWDETFFTDANGVSQNVYHGNSRLIERGKQQPPSIIAPGGSTSDAIFPADQIRFESSYDNLSNSGWVIDPILPVYYFDMKYRQAMDNDDATLRNFVSQAKGKYLFSVTMTLDMGGDKRSYMFQFNVTDAQLIDKWEKKDESAK